MWGAVVLEKQPSSPVLGNLIINQVWREIQSVSSPPFSFHKVKSAYAMKLWLHRYGNHANEHRGLVIRALGCSRTFWQEPKQDSKDLESENHNQTKILNRWQDTCCTLPFCNPNDWHHCWPIAFFVSGAILQVTGQREAREQLSKQKKRARRSRGHRHSECSSYVHRRGQRAETELRAATAMI